MRQPALVRGSPLKATLWEFRKEFLVVGVFSMVANLLMLTPTIYMLQVFDRVMISQSGLTLISVSLIALFFFVVMAFSEWSRSRLLVRAGVRFDELLNTKVFNASFESALNHAGSKPAEAFADLTNIRQFLTGNGIISFFDAPWIPIYIGVAWLLHPWLGILALIFALFLAALAWGGHRLTIQGNEKSVESNIKVNSFVQSKLRNAEVVEAMGMLDSLRRRWLNQHRQQLDIHAHSMDVNHRVQAFTKFVQYTQQSLMLGAGAVLVIRGELSPGAMIAANVLMSRALQPVQLIVGTWKSFITARVSFRRLDALLIAYPERVGQTVNETPRGQVELHGLVAKASGREQPILKGLDAEFAAGDLVVILGPSGSGKSTLARCLVGIWSDTEGAVLLDGTPIGSWDRHELGPHLGYLPQDIELFEGTIAENIARFSEVDSNKVIEAAQRAGIHEMILHFPQGYDTPMGMAGGLLSGGQRQRVALARAMYGNPALLVLDEPNANLDDVGEVALVNAIQYLKSLGKTVILISHRTSIVGVADRLMIMANGQIQMQGPRADVLATLQRTQSVAASAHPVP